jgi:hypothetical protein
MKQTAVEWLLENLNSEPYSEEEFNYNRDCWDKAKEMEREQIAQSFEDGEYNYFYSKEDGKDFENGFEYYNEKFKQQKQ